MGNRLKRGGRPIPPGSRAIRRILSMTILMAAFSVLAHALPSSADETIGVVRSSSGQAAVIRGDKTLSAAPGTKLYAGDVLATGPGGSMGVLLRDDTGLSLGPESRLAIREFLFSPAEGRLGLVARLFKGTMACFSGLIGKLAPEKARFETPVATIGIRGTRFAVKAGEHAFPGGSRD